MGFLDSSSAIVTTILTRKGRELIAKNNGEFKITKFAFGDDEINYQLYNAATDTDTDILNLPVLEPSSNESTALRYRLVTIPQGAVAVAYLIASPNTLVFRVGTARTLTPTISVIVVTTKNGYDSKYTAVSRDSRIAKVINSGSVDSSPQEDGTYSAFIQVSPGDIGGRSTPGTTFVDISGVDTGAVISIPVSTIGTIAD